MDDPVGFAALVIIGLVMLGIAVAVGSGSGRRPFAKRPEDAESAAELAAEYDRNRTSAIEMADRANLDQRH